MRDVPYTKHLVDTGRLSVVKDAWPFEKDTVVQFEARGNSIHELATSFVADYHYLSMFTTGDAVPVIRPTRNRDVGGVFDGWAVEADRLTKSSAAA